MTTKEILHDLRFKRGMTQTSIAASVARLDKLNTVIEHLEKEPFPLNLDMFSSIIDFLTEKDSNANIPL